MSQVHGVRSDVAYLIGVYLNDRQPGNIIPRVVSDPHGDARHTVENTYRQSQSLYVPNGKMMAILTCPARTPQGCRIQLFRFELHLSKAPGRGLVLAKQTPK